MYFCTTRQALTRLTRDGSCHPLRSLPISRTSLRAHTEHCAVSRASICSDDEFPKVIARRPFPRVAGDQRCVRCFSWGGQKGQCYVLYPVTPLPLRRSPPRRRKRLHSMHSRSDLKFACTRCIHVLELYNSCNKFSE